MKRIISLTALVVLLGFGCGAGAPKGQPYPGDEPYVSPAAPPPGR